MLSSILHILASALSALILVGAFGFAERFAGTCAPSDKPPGRVVWAAAMLAVVGFFLAGWLGFWFAMVWLGWRTPRWRLFPVPAATLSAWDFAQTAVRHALAPALAAAVALIMGRDLLATTLPLAVWAVFAAFLSWFFTDHQLAPDGTPDYCGLELARGASFGVAVAFAVQALP